MRTITVYGIIFIVAIVISIWVSSDKERQCADVGGKPIYSLVGLFSSCVAQTS